MALPEPAGFQHISAKSGTRLIISSALHEVHREYIVMLPEMLE
jgi:hypothetical protein